MGRCVLALVVCVNSAANSLSFPTEDIELTQIKPKDTPSLRNSSDLYNCLVLEQDGMPRALYHP